MRERRATRERSKDRERRSSRSRQDDLRSDSRGSPIKRSQSGRMLDASGSGGGRKEAATIARGRSSAGDKPKSLSFRVSPAGHHFEHQAVITTQKSSSSATMAAAQKSAKFSETHTHVMTAAGGSEVKSGSSTMAAAETDRQSSVPPPLPVRKGRQQRSSEPVLYSSMPRAQLGNSGVSTYSQTSPQKQVNIYFLLEMTDECVRLDMKICRDARSFING